MSFPKVSVIMAARNTASFLPACLDSVLKQTYPKWELIAVNDHSTDDTLQVLKTYSQKDSRIKVFNSGRERLIPTLKEGYRHVSGTLVNRMDSDDKMPVYKLEVLVNEWQRYGRGNIVAGGTKHFVDEGEVGDGFKRYERWLNNVAKTNSHYREIYKECVIPSHCWLIHKKDFDDVGAFEPEVYPEDYDLCFRFYENKLNVVGLDKVLHLWRDRSERISRTWECYKDNRYFQLKLRYFYRLDRDVKRPLVLWGAGRNGKDMAKLLKRKEEKFYWVCDNPNKIGKEVNGINMKHYSEIEKMENPQIIVVVASPKGKTAIKKQLEEYGKKQVEDYWFFL